MSAWDEYPPDYRLREVQYITASARAGASMALVGLSGSGKSNLLGFLVNQQDLHDSQPGSEKPVHFFLVDCNRMDETAPQGFFRLLLKALQPESNIADNIDVRVLEKALSKHLFEKTSICLILDRFDVLTELTSFTQIAGNMRALRDAFKYHLSFVVAIRHLLVPNNELAELFFGRTLWLGPLNYNDALWSARRDLQRMTNQPYTEQILDTLREISGGYPSLLRAVCEAYAQGAKPTLEEMSNHPVVEWRLREFWADGPQVEELHQSKLLDIPLLQTGRFKIQQQPIQKKAGFDTSLLTAKEYLLLEYLMARPSMVCGKDDLVQAVWPEEVIFEKGVRDESLAQLIRRLRVKIEPDPGDPKHIHTVAGRGYLFKP